MSRSTRLLLALLAAPIALAATPVLAADEAPAGYTKKVVAVYQGANDPNGRAMAQALEDLGRFQMLPVSSDGSEGVPGFVAKVKSASAAAGTGQVPAYVFSSRFAYGAIQATEMKTDSRTDTATGKTTGETYAFLECPLYFTVEVFEASTGRLIKQLQYTEKMQRKYKYDFTEVTTPDAHREKQRELMNTLMRDQRVPPEVSFKDKAFDEMRGLIHGSMIADVRRMPEFSLSVGVSGWDGRADRVIFGLGQDLKVHVDDAFKVYQDGREVGFLKVRQVGKSSSSAQPIFMDASLKVGDKVVEYPKANWWNGFKGGVVWMGGPGFMASYDGDMDIGTLFGVSELSFNYHGAYLTGNKVNGFQGELGFSKKWFVRRWGFGVGPRFGVTALNGGGTNATAPGFTLMGNMHCYLTPDIVWTTDLGLSAYSTIDPAKMGVTGLPAGAKVNPLGPVVQTGFTFVF